MDERLKEIDDAWKKYYPKHFAEREFFEDLMANYRYKTTDGWARTSNIAENFKGVDFYKDFTEVGNDIYAKAAVSMKTTIVKNVENWLNSTPIRNNLNNLTKGISKGIKWNSKTLFYEKAELHIYMKKSDITPQLKSEWLERLNKDYPQIKFEINSLDDFIN